MVQKLDSTILNKSQSQNILSITQLKKDPDILGMIVTNLTNFIFKLKNKNNLCVFNNYHN